ncbi:replication protein [Prescottella equi]|uniref:replication protein n=1 Tax=Rhodococcus hoagii TaxID=43767 RepID=UPI0030104A55
MIWLLSKPADWRTRSEAIAAQSPKEGREAIRSAMRELREAGYMVTERVQDPETGRWSTITTVFEEPITEAGSSVPPESRNPLGGKRTDGELDALTKNESRRTETNHHGGRGPRQCQPDRTSPLPSSAKSVLPEVDPKFAELERAVHDGGLAISFGRISPTAQDEIHALVDVHGVPSMVAAAVKAHRPDNPTRHAHGLLPLWKAMPRPRAVRPAVPLCGKCVEGWLDDDELGRAVRCSCRSTAASGGAR